MSEKVESGLEVVAWAHPDYCDVITDSQTRTIEWERRGVSPIPLVRQSDAERALQLEMERHRKTWRQLEQVTGLLREATEAMNKAHDSMFEQCLSNPITNAWGKPVNTTHLNNLQDVALRAEAALSQQAEPTDTYTATDMATAAAQGFRDGQAAVKPAPAQDGREAFEAWFDKETAPKVSYGNPDILRRSLRPAFEAGAAWERTRHAQTEQQQPVAWRWLYNGEPDSDRAFPLPLPDAGVIARGLQAERPRTVQVLYAAPVAQTELAEALRLALPIVEHEAKKMQSAEQQFPTGFDSTEAVKALAAIKAALAPACKGAP